MDFVEKLIGIWKIRKQAALLFKPQGLKLEEKSFKSEKYCTDTLRG